MPNPNAVRILESSALGFRLADYPVDEDDLSAPAVADKIGLLEAVRLGNLSAEWADLG